jgi:hypothetical protein
VNWGSFMMFFLVMFCCVDSYVGADISGLKMKTVIFSKTLVSTYESTQSHNLEQHCHLGCHENLKSHMGQLSFSRGGFNHNESVDCYLPLQFKYSKA